jgi:hypothetical protein
MLRTLKPIYAHTVEVTISNLHSLILSMELWNAAYAELKAQCELAWKVYDDAIEVQEPSAEIDRLGKMAESFEDVKRAAWHNWQNAQAQYLQALN